MLEKQSEANLRAVLCKLTVSDTIGQLSETEHKNGVPSVIRDDYSKLLRLLSLFSTHTKHTETLMFDLGLLPTTLPAHLLNRKKPHFVNK